LTEADKKHDAARTLLAGAPLFADLPEAIIEAIAEQSNLRHFERGEAVLSPGQFDGAEFLYLASGRLKASRADPATGSMVVESISQGSFFALTLAVLPADEAGFSNLTILAETAVDAVFVEVEAFRALVAQRPLLARCLLLHFARVAAGGGAGPQAAEASPDRRVFAAVASLVRRDAVEGAWRINRMPKHRDLAEIADVAEADAASAVARLIASGVARRDYPGLVIDDMAQLNRLAR
jgi:CRP-like cAMP-binding protein